MFGLGWVILDFMAYQPFNDKSSLYILNIYDLVGFDGISTLVGYLIPNLLYTYDLYIDIFKCTETSLFV